MVKDLVKGYIKNKKEIDLFDIEEIEQKNIILKEIKYCKDTLFFSYNIIR